MQRRLLLGMGLLGILIVCVYVLIASRESSVGVASNAAFASFDMPALGGFARATAPYDWQFPADYGSHPEYQTEWWYYTGNLTTSAGRSFGYQFTVFRRAIRANAIVSDSEWRSSQLFMAHFTVTDVASGQFYQSQRYSRGAAGLAGATTEPTYRVWLDDWQVYALSGDATQTRIMATSDAVRLDLALDQAKPPVLQGDDGLSQKSPGIGYASYYYSLPRLSTHGTISVDGESYSLDGWSWMDHEFGTQSLGSDVQGWDWFGLHFADGRDLMVGQIRLMTGGIEPVYQGVLVAKDGSARILSSAEFSIESIDTWHSAQTGITYPAAWSITIDIGSLQELRLTVKPLVADQELREGTVVYWEGAVAVSGDAQGYGYAELTGYGDAMRGRF